MKRDIDKKRMIQYDLLRIFAAFSVVMLHSAAQFWYALDIKSTEWIIANSYDAVFRFGVPVFVMISGALFLAPDYELDTKRLYKHNILRLVVIYVVWSCLYGLMDSKLLFDLRLSDMKLIIKEMLGSRYHLWYLPMIVGIYVLLPVLKSWVEHAEKKNLQYFLGLFFVLQIGAETIRALTFTDELHTLLNLTKVELICSYAGYFVLGYYLAHVGISDKLRKILYISVIPSVVLNILLGNLLAWKAGKPVGTIYDSFGIFTFLLSAAMFVYAVEWGRKKSVSDRYAGIVKEVSACTLGIYVMHVGLMEFAQMKGIHNMLLPNIIGIPLYAICSFVICLGASALLRRIPIIGKYIC